MVTNQDRRHLGRDSPGSFLLVNDTKWPALQ
jgi:hypothetical protein